MAQLVNKAPSVRSRIRQSAVRADYDQAVVYQIVDEALIGTVSVATEQGPMAIPMAIARVGDYIYLHGSRSSRLMQHIATGNEVCVSITHLDGIVVARSGMHCSANYRSVIVHGKGEEVTDPKQHADLLYQITYQIIPGSEGDFRPHLAKELKATTLVAISLEESACKIREGGPKDEKGDEDLPYWAGVIPIKQLYGQPIPAVDLLEGIETPDYALRYRRQ